MAGKWSESQRQELFEWLNEEPNVNWTTLGKHLSLHRSSIQREVGRFGGRNGYRPALAQKTAEKAKSRPKVTKLSIAGELLERVIKELKLHRSPVAIWADLVSEGAANRVCVETIYKAVYGGILGINATECLRRRRRKRRSRQSRQENKRPGLPNISSRPAFINERSEIGHWEADHMIGSRNGSALMSLTERLTRYGMLLVMPEGYKADEALAGLCEAFDQIPPHLRKSVTFDQGSEWAEWETLSATFDMDVWFCDPHSPWQRGQIENQNGHYRHWFPKGTRLDNIEQREATAVNDLINNQRRKSLLYKSPAELYNKACAL